MRTEWQRLRSNDCVDSFSADALANFFLRTCCVKHKQHDMREPGLLKEEIRCTEILCLCSKTYRCYDVTSNNLKFRSEGLNECVMEQSGDGPLERYRRVLNENVKVTSNIIGFRRNKHSVATYEQVKKSVSDVYLRRIVESDGIHTQFVRFPLLFYFIMSCICLNLYILKNFLKHYYNFFYIALRYISIRTLIKTNARVKKTSARVINIPHA